MRINHLLSAVLVASMSMSFAACNKNNGGGVSQPAAVGSSELLLVNNSAEPIFYIHMSPSNDTNWGPDLLGEAVLHVGEQFRITGIAAGVWDIRVVDSSGNKKEFYRQNVGTSGSYNLNIDSYGWTR